MSESLYGSVYDNEQQLPVHPRWRRMASTLLHLVIVSLTAVVTGIYLFPIQ